ncbi:diguanylate cyclase [Leclercia adecarboxylata]|uniref:GGDEF domain-containing protein n=1 Tax=Leclercia adecarboxylata TaxID=83655 RepID=UPI002DBE6261|nr:diguanylate cyclase [Leclercia adecarboxylata]MEB6377608.1 diguanylate cyclase [Leclercia adecarboxylata]
MPSAETRTFTLFQPHSPFRNATAIFLLTTLFYFIGAQLRLVEALSLFWPLNGVMAGVFARYAWLNRLHYYAIAYIAMLVYDLITTEWGIASLGINLSNMVFIVTVAVLLQRDKRLNISTPDPVNALRLFNYCLLAALLCALVGATVSGGVSNRNFWPLVADWFSEQFSTGVLIVPCLLTITWPAFNRALRIDHLMPVVALIISVIASVAIGGAGALVFPLPALIWCAVRYSLPATCLLTFVTGAVEITLVANSIITIVATTPLTTPMMFSARLGIATMAICPLLVSVSMAAINSLIRQVSLRADYDFLTQVYSRSGLYEALKNDEGKRKSPRLTVMLLDIDYFKSINDNYGHECGDTVLAAFARKVQETVGSEGLVARMGGEEFAVVVNAVSSEQAYALAERIRTSVEQHPFSWRGQSLFLTVSIGLGSGKSEPSQLTEVFNRLMTEADEYLYRSKKAGRNRTSARMTELKTAGQRTEPTEQL